MSVATRVLWGCCLAMAILAPVRAQETFTHEKSGLKFTLPAGWTYTQEGDHFEAASPDDSAALLFFVGRGDEVEAIVDGAVDALADIIRDPKLTTDLTEEVINGLLQVYVEGDGLIDGETVDWDLTVIRGGGRSSMVIVALGDIDSNQRVFDRIYRSVRK